MKIILLCCACYLVHAAVIVFAMFRSARIADEAMEQHFKHRKP